TAGASSRTPHKLTPFHVQCFLERDWAAASGHTQADWPLERFHCKGDNGGMMSQLRVPLTDVTLGEEEAAAAARVVRSGWLTMGPEVEAFEREFAEAIGAAHAIAVCNGTAALQIAYRAAGLGEGDSFALPALTFVATMNAGLA